MIKAKAFEFIKEKGKYVADGIDMAFAGDENGNVENLEEALLVIRKDHEKPTDEDIERFYELMNDLDMFESQMFTELYNAVDVEITNEQLGIIQARDE